MNEEILAYEKHKNLKLAANELGIYWQTLYFRLKKYGVKITGDKARYGSDKDRLASLAENEFQKLVPFAENQNSIKFQSKIDFIVNGVSVDIKSSMQRQASKRFKSKRWVFSVKKQEFCADFIVCFGFEDDFKYKLFLIPGEFIRNYQTISISYSLNTKWKEFEINKNNLLDFFNSLSKI